MHRGQSAVEVGDGFSLPLQPSGFGGFDAIQETDVVTPRNLCNKLLHNCFIRPGFAERAHVFQVPRRESFHIRERSLEVRRQTVDHFRAPVFPFLPVEDIAADLSVEQDQLSIDGHRRAKLRRSNPPRSNPPFRSARNCP